MAASTLQDRGIRKQSPVPPANERGIQASTIGNRCDGYWTVNVTVP
jgi:hypothetical protein